MSWSELGELGTPQGSILQLDLARRPRRNLPLTEGDRVR